MTQKGFLVERAVHEDGTTVKSYLSLLSLSGGCVHWAAKDIACVFDTRAEAHMWAAMFYEKSIGADNNIANYYVVPCDETNSGRENYLIVERTTQKGEVSYYHYEAGDGSYFVEDITQADRFRTTDEVLKLCEDLRAKTPSMIFNYVAVSPMIDTHPLPTRYIIERKTQAGVRTFLRVSADAVCAYNWTSDFYMASKLSDRQLVLLIISTLKLSYPNDEILYLTFTGTHDSSTKDMTKITKNALEPSPRDTINHAIETVRYHLSVIRVFAWREAEDYDDRKDLYIDIDQCQKSLNGLRQYLQGGEHVSRDTNKT